MKRIDGFVISLCQNTSFITMLSKAILIFIFSFSVQEYCSCENGTLLLIATVFRHGNRTNGEKNTYPNNPYANATYYPYGYGQLTNGGKIQAYRLGRTFRTLYHSFLGPLYVPNIVNATSTHYPRTKASLQLFLAGLFPPQNTPLEWNSDVNWNPIPFNYVHRDNRIFAYPMRNCPKFQRAFNIYSKSPEAIAIKNYHKRHFSYISDNTGLNISTVWQLFHLYQTLSINKEWGFELPAWTKSVYPDYLEQATGDSFKLITATPEMNSLYGGFLLKEIIQNFRLRIDGSRKETKIYAYSGHIGTVISTLAALNLFKPHAPAYSACVVLELHRINQKEYVKVRYNQFGTFTDMKIPGCKTMCLMEDFLRLLEKNLPQSDDACNE